MTSSLILGIETATPSGGIALAQADGKLLAHRWSTVRTAYSRRLMEMIDATLADCSAAKSDLRAIAVSAGPGSFTGVRVGLITAKTLAYALGVPLYSFSTLRSTALRWPLRSGLICVMLDARRGEIYSGLYKISPGGNLENAREEKVESSSQLLEALDHQVDGEIWFSGDGVDPKRDEIAARLGDRARWVPSPWNVPAADSVALAGARSLSEGDRGVDPFNAVPHYLRLSDAEKKRAVKAT